MIVLMCGKAGTGKDTVAQHLCNEYGFKQDYLSAPLKRLVSDIFVVPYHIVHPETADDRLAREKEMANWPGWTVRKLLQYIGTEMFRTHICADVWVRSLCLRMNKEKRNWVVSDVRFPNEKEVVLKTATDPVLTLKVTRPIEGTGAIGIQGHASEAHDIEADYTIENDGGFDTLYDRVDDALLQWEHTSPAIKKKIKERRGQMTFGFQGA